ncbi:hypothetical protein DSO57_1029485 [Entomophthora muscae]|uniref:Uncharacterized protein n=1 Tax=Entomophthora muscae TaxID=34485 RepID=A0ACC2TDE6_9FUNG|nr:hypothetical protein DSO57_1029485 [Entomophthora muscae]
MESSCPTPNLATYLIPTATLLYLAVSLIQCNILAKAFHQAVNFYPIVYALNVFEPPNLPSYVTKVLPSILGYYRLPAAPESMAWMALQMASSEGEELASISKGAGVREGG